jgi:hypothetical protein
VFKVSFFIAKKPQVALDDFRRYWLGEHAELVSRYAQQIGVRQYIKCEVLHDHPMTLEGTKAYQTAPSRYDFVDHWVFNDINELRLGAKLPEVISLMQAANDSESEYVDHAHSNVQMSVDLPQFFPVDGNDVRATEDSPYLKIYYTVRVFPHLSRAQAQLHWNACHGAESRQHIRYSSQKKYIQAHAIDSTFVDRLSAECGYDVDPTFIGHAEGWIDPDHGPKNIPEDEMARIVGMTMDDIDLFSDKSRGHVFFCKEHFVLDEPPVARTKRTNTTDGGNSMPAFFSALYD